VIWADSPDWFFDQLHPLPDWLTTYSVLSKTDDYTLWENHLAEYRTVDPDFNPGFGPDFDCDPLHIEFGLVGWRYHFRHALEVSKLCGPLSEDQLAMSYFMMQNGGKVSHPGVQNFRRTRAYYRLTVEEYEDTKAWHCHPDYKMWWDVFLEARAENYMGLGDDEYVKLIDPKVHRKLKDKTYPTVDWKGRG